MSDFIKSIKAVLYDRSISPLYGTFAASWVLWNYRFVFLLFSKSMDMDKKFDYISNVLYDGFYDQWIRAFILPILTTFVAIYGYPYLSKPVYSEVRRRQKELRDIKQSFADLQLLDEKESRAIYKLLLDQEREFGAVTKSLNDEVGRYKTMYAELTEKFNTANAAKGGVDQAADISANAASDSNKSPVDLSESQARLLTHIGAADRPNRRDMLMTVEGLARVRMELDLDTLVRKNLITSPGKSTSRDNYASPYFKLTNTGMEEVLRYASASENSDNKAFWGPK